MLKKFFLQTGIILAIVFVACHSENPRDVAYNKIIALQKNDSLLKSNNRGLFMDSIIRACESFVATYPNDSMADDLLFQTSNYQATQQRFRLALVQIDKLLKIYPQSNCYTAALFIKGEVLSANLNDKVEAKKVWEDLISRFPEDRWAKEAKASIPLLEFNSVEEQFQYIIKNREKNNIK